LKVRKIIVIGGGASGMIAAGIAAKQNLQVILIEKNPILGKKLLITGKGRCNITNYSDIENHIDNIPVNGQFMRNVYYQYSPYDLISFLNNLGLKTKIERGNRVFPVSDKASDVVKTFKKFLSNNVRILQGNVKEIILLKKHFNVILTNKEKISADSVIIATGGKSYTGTGSTGAGYKFAKKFGHTIIPLKPSLVPIEAKNFHNYNGSINPNHLILQLQGLSLKNIFIKILDKDNHIIYKDFGEMLFTHFGISGPIILSATSHIRKIENNILIIDLKPALSYEQLDKRIQREIIENSQKKYINLLKSLLPKKFIPVFIELSNIPEDKPVNSITKKERNIIVKLLKNITVKLEKFRPINEAIITSGGVSVKEINPKTMESKLVKGLFFVGEIIDVNAYTGGYNLQIAFSTGYVAGMNC